MLLITRREGEAIVVNGTIEVRVLEIKGGRVKLGFEYPQGNTVFRQELFQKIQAENQAAAATVQAGSAGLHAALGKLGVGGGPKVGTAPATEMGKPESPTDANHATHPRRRSTDQT
jgi:carbon storage regulator